MDDDPKTIADAHDRGRLDTRAMLASGEMSDEYSLKLARGSFALTFWIVLALAVWLVLGRHWAIWKVALAFPVAWFVLGAGWGMVQALAIGLILANRRR